MVLLAIAREIIKQAHQVELVLPSTCRVLSSKNKNDFNDTNATVAANLHDIMTFNPTVATDPPDTQMYLRIKQCLIKRRT